jgi:hypothetical protein
MVLSIHMFYAVDNALVKWLHINSSVQRQIQQSYMLQIKTLIIVSRTFQLMDLNNFAGYLIIETCDSPVGIAVGYRLDT